MGLGRGWAQALFLLPWQPWAPVCSELGVGSDKQSMTGQKSQNPQMLRIQLPWGLDGLPGGTYKDEGGRAQRQGGKDEIRLRAAEPKARHLCLQVTWRGAGSSDWPMGTYRGSAQVEGRSRQGGGQQRPEVNPGARLHAQRVLR